MESRAKAGKISGWLALGVTSAIAVCAFLFYHPGSPRPGESPRPETREAVALVRQPDRQTKGPGTGSPLTPAAARPAGGHQSAGEQALNRLDRSMGGVSREETRAVLNEANKKLQASGAPPCTTRQGDGNPSLVVTDGQLGARGAGPLAAALVRCADAVEQVVR